MRNDIYSQAEPYTKKQRSRHRWIKITAFFACIVATATVYLLMIPTETLSGTAYCGQEEHTHTEDCYERVLACGYDDEDTQGHFHTKDCYVQEQVLICEQEETPGHVHDESCVQREQNLICADTSEDHVHTDECYETVETYICGLTEGEGGHTHGPECYETEDVLVCELPEAHIHTDACYEMVLACEKEEHTHSLGCYADTTADVESEAVWERTVSDVELTGVWADDVVAIARSQLGYTESEKNYIVDENGKAKGYTRYGAWYGDAYGDWCAMFVSFCLSYADIPEADMPREASCPRWVEKLDDLGMYLPAAYASGVGPGDVVFFDWDGDGWADHVGLVTEATESQITTIEGNSGDQVKENKYSLTDSSILGYGYLPENPEQPAEAEPETASLSAFTSFFSNDLSLGASNGVSLAAAGDEEGSGTETGEGEEGGVPTAQSNDDAFKITKALASGVIYDPDNKVYSMSIALSYELNKDTAESPYTYEFTLKNVEIPDDLLNDSHALMASDEQAHGIYIFTKNDDGTYLVKVEFQEDYVKSAEGNVTGTIEVKASASETYWQAGDKVEFEAVTGCTVTIPSTEIKYPSDETRNYDVSVEKIANYNKESNTIEYTVYVYSKKGTPELTVTDVMSAQIDMEGPLNVTVKKMTGKMYSWSNGIPGNWVSGDTVTGKNFVSDGKMVLDGLAAGVTKNDSNDYLECYGYEITYTYQLPEGYVGTQEVKNTVTATGTSSGETVTDEYTADIYPTRNYQMDKSGTYADGKITWTIHVNSDHMNIAGMTLSDDMFEDMVSDSLKVTCSDGSPVEYALADKTLTFGENNGINTNSYTITYQTVATGSWEGKTYTNKAELKKDSAIVVEATGSVTVTSGSVNKSVTGSAIDKDGKTAQVQWTVNITLPDEITENATITDIFGSNMYMTWDQIKEWAGLVELHFTYQNVHHDNLGGSDTYVEQQWSEYWPAGKYLVVLEDEDGNTYDFKAVDGNDGGNFYGKKYTIKSITIDKSLLSGLDQNNHSLKFTYWTTVDLTTAKEGTNSYYNTVNVGNKWSTATWNYTKGYVKKMSANDWSGNDTTVTNSDRKLSWRVEASLSDGDQKTDVTITDTLPSGVNLTSLRFDVNGQYVSWDSIENAGEKEITVWDNSLQRNINIYAKPRYDSDRNVCVDIWCTEANGDTKIYIPTNLVFYTLYNCEIENSYQEDNTLVQRTDDSGDTWYTFKNTATFEGMSDSQTQEWCYVESTGGGGDDPDVVTGDDALAKTGEYDNDSQQVNYELVINKNGDTLNNGNPLTLEDVLSYSISEDGKLNWGTDRRYSLVYGSVHLYYGAELTYGAGGAIINQPVSAVDWSWTYNEVYQDVNWQAYYYHTITAKVPDNVALILVYSYSVSFGNTQDPNNATTQNINLGANNTATLTGNHQSNVKVDDRWQESGTSGTIAAPGKYTFIKVKSGDYTITLSGAEFTLYAYDSATKDYVNTNVIYTTDKDGKLSVNVKDTETYGFQENTAYYLVETKAPDGYRVNDTPYYFWFNNNGDTEQKIPAYAPTGFPIDAPNLASTSGEAIVADEPIETTQITVKKVWVDSDGNTVSGSDSGLPNSVTLQLYQSVDTSDASGSATVSIVIRKGTDGNGENWWKTDADIVATSLNATFTITLENCSDTNIVPKLTLNGEQITAKKTEQFYTYTTWNRPDVKFTYEIHLNKGKNVIAGETSFWDNAVHSDLIYETSSDDTVVTKPYESEFTITASEGWNKTISNLPKTDEHGRPYTYTVQEVVPQNAQYTWKETTYDGIVKITNELNPGYTPPTDYELPATGGKGTKRYRFAGLLAVTGAAAGLLRKRRKTSRA